VEQGNWVMICAWNSMLGPFENQLREAVVCFVVFLLPASW